MKKLPVWAVALIFSLIGIIAVLLYRFNTSPHTPELNIYVAFVFGVLFFITSFSFAATDKIEAEKGKFEIKGWRIIFYIIGLLTGIFNLMFWLIALGSYVRRGMETRKPSKVTFFGHHFQTLAFNWGVLMSCVILISLGAIYNEERIATRDEIVNEYNQILTIDEEYSEKFVRQLVLLNELADKQDLESFKQYLIEADKLFKLQNEYEQFANQTNDFFDENAETLTKEGVDIDAQKAELQKAIVYIDERFKTVRDNVELLNKDGGLE